MFKIVTADDEKMIKRSMRKLIEKADAPFFITGEATNGREALDIIRSDPPQLLITDICMPLMDGLQLIATVKEEYRAMEVVVISGYSDFDYARQAIRYGVTDYLLKPIDPAEFTGLLLRIYERHEDNNRKIAERGERLGTFIEEGEHIVDRIWTIQEEALRAKLKDIEAARNDQVSELDELKETYMEQLLYIVNKLESKSGHPFDKDEALRLKEAHTREAAHRLFQHACFGFIREVSCLRNPAQSLYIRKTIEEIEAQYADSELSLLRAAERASMSVTYFTRLFKQEAGTTFMKYVTDVRMTKAKQLLAQQDRKVGDVALEVGYTNYHHFAKAFRKYHGITPTQYRKAYEQRG
ncbi:helix-turn-helix domain-containing protein [Paenibacillus sp.]|uniref:response regulator transcription factor n=1 Tax=Paenibacillus sp. TaxID=58172 RepID=UPI0028122E96|nr:helix-turn-helix domain-containing protein [Paenibacillus sp.]